MSDEGSPPRLPEHATEPVIETPKQPAKRKRGRGAVWVIVLLLFALAGSGLLNLMLLMSSSLGGVTASRSRDRIPETVLQKASGTRAKIVHLDLDGVITSFSTGTGGITQLAKELRQAAKDDDVKAVVLRINSPGGEVTASDTLYNEVKKVNEVKPVIVYMDSVAASGGYYIACGASKIVSSSTTLTGSIGVIMQSINYREMFEKVGLDAVTFRSGDFKDMLSGSREMRDDEKEYVQSLVNEMYDRFVGIVAEARGLNVEALKQGVADGRVVTGDVALKEKLVDATGYLEDAYALALEESGEKSASIVAYQQPFSFGNLAGLLGKAEQAASAETKIEIDVSERLMPRLQSGVLYYLMPPLASGSGEISGH